MLFKVCDVLTRYAPGKKRNTGYVKTKHTGSGQDVGPVKRQNGNLYICQECCNTEHCNMYGCNDPSEFITSLIELSVCLFDGV